MRRRLGVSVRHGSMRFRGAVALALATVLSGAGLAASPAQAAADDDELTAGQQLKPTQSLVSAGGGQVAVVQKTGELALYEVGGDLRWTSGPGVKGSRLVVRSTGDVALVAPDGTVGWHTGTKGVKGARLVVQDDGDLVVRDTKGTVQWSAGTATPPTMLNAGDELEPGKVLSSQDGRSTLVMGEDGDLQLLGPDARPRWSTDTDRAGSSLVLSEQGDLAVRTDAGYIRWHTGTWGHEDATLVLQDDGDLQLLDPDGTVLWSTGTALGEPELAAGKRLDAGERLDSPDGRVSLRVDEDGLRLEIDGRAVWAVVPAYPDAELRLSLGKSGDLVLKGTDGAIYWTSETTGSPGATLAVDSGGLVLRAANGEELWRADVPPDALGSPVTSDCSAVVAPVPFEATALTSTGIRLNPCLVTAVESLQAAAKADGIDLSGWGWRSNEQQRALRARNCNASGCRPATATPGTSRHERGLAIDFTVDGHVITAGSAAWTWMVRNAPTYGLKNLPGEPWHWSVDGW